MRRLCTFVGLGCLLVVGTACRTTREYYRPRESSQAESPKGFPAAQYPLARDGKVWGELRVWSEGSFFDDVDGQEHTLLHIGLEIENRAGEQVFLDVDESRVSAISAGEGGDREARAQDLEGLLGVGAGEVSVVDLRFRMPPGVEPGNLASFRFNWSIRGPEGRIYERSTPFRVDVRRRYYYYDPYPVWSIGFGYWGSWCW